MNTSQCTNPSIISLHSIPLHGLLVKLGINKTESRSDSPCKGFFLEGRKKSPELFFEKEKTSLVF